LANAAHLFFHPTSLRRIMKTHSRFVLAKTLDDHGAGGDSCHQLKQLLNLDELPRGAGAPYLRVPLVELEDAFWVNNHLQNIEPKHYLSLDALDEFLTKLDVVLRDVKMRFTEASTLIITAVTHTDAFHAQLSAFTGDLSDPPFVGCTCENPDLYDSGLLRFIGQAVKIREALRAARERLTDDGWSLFYEED
jgi:hypothetical protein